MVHLLVSDLNNHRFMIKCSMNEYSIKHAICEYMKEMFKQLFCYKNDIDRLDIFYTEYHLSVEYQEELEYEVEKIILIYRGAIIDQYSIDNEIAEFDDIIWFSTDYEYYI